MITTVCASRSRLLLWLLMGVAHASCPARAELNDTGQDLCAEQVEGTVEMVECTPENTGDTATAPRQDGRFGRDAAARVGNLSKTGAGVAGFDFTKSKEIRG